MIKWTAAVLLTLGSLTAQRHTEPLVTWRGKVLPVTTLAADASLARSARNSITVWSHWATPRGYRLVLSESGQVLLVLSPTYARRSGGRKEDNTARRFLKSVESTIEELDRLLPNMPAETAVVVGARQTDYPAVLQSVAEQNPKLGSWVTAAARTTAGFTLAHPAVSVWLEDPPDTEEWNPENEVVHRTAAALWSAAGEHAPQWLRLGLSWHVEERVLGSIYCFPNRAGFVSVYDHGDWDKALKQLFKNRRKQPLALAEVASWNPRAGYDAKQGYLAFGVARYLADYAPQSLAPLLTALHELAAEKRKVKTGTYSWKIDPDYRLPIDEQERLCAAHAGGAALMADITRFFQQGKRYRRRS